MKGCEDAVCLMQLVFSSAVPPMWDLWGGSCSLLGPSCAQGRHAVFVLVCVVSVGAAGIWWRSYSPMSCLITCTSGPSVEALLLLAGSCWCSSCYCSVLLNSVCKSAGLWVRGKQWILLQSILVLLHSRQVLSSCPLVLRSGESLLTKCCIMLLALFSCFCQRMLKPCGICFLIPSLTATVRRLQNGGECVERNEKLRQSSLRCLPSL